MNQATPAASAHWAICQLLSASGRAGPPVSSTEVRPRRQSRSSGCGLHGPRWCQRVAERSLVRGRLTRAEDRRVATPLDPTALGLPDGREPPDADARRGPAALQEARGGRPQLRPRPVRGGARHHRHRAAVPQAARTARSRRPASGCGSRTTSSTSSTTSATARCPSPAGSASCSSWCPGCTAPGWRPSGRCGSGTSSRACATAGWRCTRSCTTRWSTASPRCGCCRASCPATPTTAACRRRGRSGRRARRSGKAQEAAEQLSAGEAMSALRTALGISADAAGIPKALVKTLNKSLRNETSTLSLYAPQHDPQPRDHRLTPVRRPGLADRTHPRHRQGHRHDAERRRAGDVQRRDAHLPLRARRAPRHHADRDGPGRPARPEGRGARPAAATPSARSWSSSAPTCPTPSRG